jgi:peptide/nickel transport system permease protein
MAGVPGETHIDGMLRHLASRLLTGLAVIAGVVALTFILLHVAPGDPARHLAGPNASAQQLAELRQGLGLDRPLVAQFLAWVGQAARGNWGTSIATGRPVGAVLREAWPATAVLVSLSLLLSYALGVLIGLVQVRLPRWADGAVTVGTTTLFAMPGYWLGVLLMWLLVYHWRLLPAFGVAGLDAEFLPPWAQLTDRLRHLALPLITLTLLGAGGTARFARGALVDVRAAGFVTAARGRGLSAAAIDRRYLLRNALVPVITLLGLSLPALFSGAVFVEAVFAWPGVGRVMVEAVQARDYPVVMAAATVSAILVVAGNILADLGLAWSDPRMRHG